MSSKILVVDDSKTIQKVVGITLAAEDYDIEECLSEGDLVTKLKEKKYDLIIVDFELSEKRPGTQLIQEISQTATGTPIMVMLGTFDNVDEDSLKSAGADEKISKPFDGAEFIQKCRGLIKPSDHDPLDNWSVGGIDSDEDELIDHEENDNGNNTETLEVSVPTGDPLQEEANDWGISVPPPLNKEESPPVSLPPEIGETQEIQIEGTEPTYSLKPEELSLETTEPAFVADLTQTASLVTDDSTQESIDGGKTRELESKLGLESEDFWSTDENADGLKNEASLEDNNKTSSALPVEVDETTQEVPLPNVNNIDKDALVRDLKEDLASEIKSIVKKYCSQKIEEIAWEVIPDLAENLIREEIKEISNRSERRDLE